MTTIVNLGVKIPSFVSKKELKEAVKVARHTANLKVGLGSLVKKYE